MRVSDLRFMRQDVMLLPEMSFFLLSGSCFLIKL